MQAIVEAVPIVLQLPAERFMPPSKARNSVAEIFPAFTASLYRHTSVPEPIGRPRNVPRIIGPPETAMVGKLELAAPIRSAGVVLSQPTSRTTPSMGFPRIDSSTSMLAKFRNNMAVGRKLVSPSDMTGNSSGKPPASHTPRFTNSASSRKGALHGVSSDHVLQIPMTGRPLNMSCGQP